MDFDYVTDAGDTDTTEVFVPNFEFNHPLAKNQEFDMILQVNRWGIKLPPSAHRAP